MKACTSYVVVIVLYEQERFAAGSDLSETTKIKSQECWQITLQHSRGIDVEAVTGLYLQWCKQKFGPLVNTILVGTENNRI